MTVTFVDELTMTPYVLLGYSIFLKIPRWIGGTLLRWLVHATFATNKLNAIPHLKLLLPSDAHLFNQLNYPSYDYPEIPHLYAAEPPSKESSQVPSKFPVMIFSHGIGGIRTTYAGLIGELVSHGWIVCAIEHSDGSAGFTRTFNRQFLPASPTDKTSEESSGLVNLPFVRLPISDNNYSEWNEKLKFRTAELDLLFTYLSALDKDDTAKFATQGESSDDVLSLHQYLKANPSKQKYFSLELAQQQKMFKDRLDLKHVVLAGHSFGSATVMECLKHSARCSHHFQGSIKSLVALDPWLFPVSKSSRYIANAGTIPMLVINSESFHWDENTNALHKFLEESNITVTSPNSPKDYSLRRLFVTLLGTSHQDQSDYPAYLPAWLAKMLGQSRANVPEWNMTSHEKILLNTFIVRAFLSSALFKHDFSLRDIFAFPKPYHAFSLDPTHPDYHFAVRLNLKEP